MNRPSLDNCLAYDGVEQPFENFFEMYKHLLPVIFMVTAGYYGADEQVFGQGEIYYAYGVHLQKRIVASDRNKKIFSIPIDYKDKFHYGNFKSVKTSKPRYMKDVLSAWQLNTNERWIMPERDQLLTYNVDAQTQVEGRLGVLEIVETIDLKYMLAHAVLCNMDTQTTTIPHYLNIDVAVATGFIGIRREVFDEWMGQLKKLVATLKHDQVKFCDAIIQFEEYNYVQPHKQYEYMRNNNPTKVLETDEYQKLELGPNRPQPSPSDPYRREKNSRTMPLPYFPSPGCDQFCFNPDAPVLPPRKAVGRRCPKAPMKLPTSGREDNQGSAKQLAPTSPPLSQNSPGQSKSLPYASQPSSPVSPLPPLPKRVDSVFRNSADRPDLRIRSKLTKMGINDVSQLLKQLGLHHHVTSFKEKQVDGSLLLDILEDSVAATDVGLTPVEVQEIGNHLDPC